MTNSKDFDMTAEMQANLRVLNPTRKPRTVDKEVYALASTFIFDANTTQPDTYYDLYDKQELAEEIQEAIETWFASKERAAMEGETP